MSPSAAGIPAGDRGTSGDQRVPGSGPRIWVVGAPGAGKSTLARALSKDLGLPHHELDRVFWRADWQRAPADEFRAAVDAIAAADSWIIDGQYEAAHPALMYTADIVIWLNPPPWLTLSRVVRRTLGRVLTRKELWNGNREGPRTAGSMIAWAVTSRGDAAAVNRRLFEGSSACPAVKITSGSVRDAHAQVRHALADGFRFRGGPGPAVPAGRERGHT